MNEPGRGPSAVMTPPGCPSGPPDFDDPRLVDAMEEYIRCRRSGEIPARSEFLDRHREIAGPLAECIDGLEFIRSAADEFAMRGPDEPWSEMVAPGTRIGDFRVVREIGRGGMGVVYEAEQISLPRRVALKILPSASALDARQRQRFRIESQAAALLHHEHIVPVFAVGCDSGFHYIAMQLISGRSLAEIIATRREWGGPGASPEAVVESTAPRSASGRGSDGVACGEPEAADGRRGSAWMSRTPSPLARTDLDPAALDPSSETRSYFRAVARLGLQAAEGLAHAHDVGVLHRDVKPSNLLVDDRLRLWLADFGLARILDDPGPTRTGDVLGTLRYASPEQVRGDVAFVDHRADLYALGATLYESLTLRPAFDGANRQELVQRILNEEARPPRQINPLIPRDLETIVLKAMAQEPSRRYGSAREIAEDLSRFLEDRPIRARRPTPFERASLWSRRHRPLLASTTVVLALALVIGSALVWKAKLRADAALASLGESKRQTDRVLESLREVRVRERIGFETAYATIDQLFDSRFSGDREAGRAPTEADRQICLTLVAFYDRIAGTFDQSQGELAAKASRRAGLYRMILRDPRADGDYGRAIRLYEGLAGRWPERIWYRTGLIDTLREYSGELDGLGRRAEAEDSLRRALAVAEGLLAEEGARLPCFQKDLAPQFEALARSLADRPSARLGDSGLADRLARWAAGGAL